MTDQTQTATIERLLERIDAESRNPDKERAERGIWLEEVTHDAAPLIREWNVAECWRWADWPDREQHFPDAGALDPGIDLVARTQDGQIIAVQCKSRQLDESGRGGDIQKGEFSKFADPSSHSLWDHRWLVVNGHVNLSNPAQRVASMHEKPITLVTLPADLRSELLARSAPSDDECEHCQRPDDKDAIQTRTCMQNEAVSRAVALLDAHLAKDTHGIPVGEARGKIVLPCGTGKTRVSLRIIERLTERGELSVVLCPSIALVAQLRREYLQHAAKPDALRVLAVCSDETAGYERKAERALSLEDDPTADEGRVSAGELKGEVTTDPSVIKAWLDDPQAATSLNVVFGTYQSGRKLAEALKLANVKVKVLVADEAHRTSGIRRKKNDDAANQERSDFTLCHDRDAFPAVYRVYQTATPRIVHTSGKPKRTNDDDPSTWIVRSMDDPGVFGPDLYRRTYQEAVANGWLADYRIIAAGISGQETFDLANELAKENPGTGARKLTASNYLRGLGLAMAMGGGTVTPEGHDEEVHIRSCIGFMNTVSKSKTMAHVLQAEDVSKWLAGWMKKHVSGKKPHEFKLEHVDASSSATRRDTVKDNLARATATPDARGHAVLNVGIFGEGTDTPDLSAVAFLEPRKSPIDVVQAVGRAMRATSDKSFGYVVVPFVVPPDVDPESWLETSRESDWPELGQILGALRAHDSRIEDNLKELMYIQMPPEPDKVETLVVVLNDAGGAYYFKHNGPPQSAAHDAKCHLAKTNGKRGRMTKLAVDVTASSAHDDEDLANLKTHQVITARMTTDAQGEHFPTMRVDAVPRGDASGGTILGDVDQKALKKHVGKMLNGKAGRMLVERPSSPAQPPGPTPPSQQSLFLLKAMRAADAIVMNLLERSGVQPDKVDRDLNLLSDGVREAAVHLRDDELESALDQHFGFHNLADPKKSKPRADGVTVAALLLMNAAMLHQRIAKGGWISGVSLLDEVAAKADIVVAVEHEWNLITREDFLPVIVPALEVLQTIRDTGKTSGLERALSHIATAAARIAETYADMGADHAGALFNKVMGDQSSDGAFFTRPSAGTLLARLALDAVDNKDNKDDWADLEMWKASKVVDLACGSGTLLQAALTDMKRRATEGGATDEQLDEFHRVAVQETLKGFDVNPVSLQLAASRLTAGNRDIKFRNMGLHLMDYGPGKHDPTKTRAGSLELLSQSAIVGTPEDTLALGEEDREDVTSEQMRMNDDHDPEDHELEEPVDAAKDARIVIINPPFTNRAKMGEKFENDDRDALRERVDALRDWMLQLDVQVDPKVNGFRDKGSIGPMFHALADRCVRPDDGVVALVGPTISFSSPSNADWRKELARRFHVHTIVTCHDPREVNMSENTAINESLIVLKRKAGDATLPTRKVALDRFPHNEDDAHELHEAILGCNPTGGTLAGGWGEVSYWPADRIDEGDWTAGIWRSPKLAEAGARFANDKSLKSLNYQRLLPAQTRLRASNGYINVGVERDDCFPVVGGSGSDGQTSITATPNQWWKHTSFQQKQLENDDDPQHSHPLSTKAGPLLITESQDSKASRLVAVASRGRYVGASWLPVNAIGIKGAKALAVFLNSTAGRVQLMNKAGRKLSYPKYEPSGVRSVRVPSLLDNRDAIAVLSKCWEETKTMEVPRYDEGECEVRQMWDEAVSKAMGGEGIWHIDKLNDLRHLLHQEPHVCGRAYGEIDLEGQAAPAAQPEPDDGEPPS